MWEYSPKIAKLVFFGINLPLQHFAWGREPQDRTLMPNFTAMALKMWPYGPQNRQKL